VSHCRNSSGGQRCGAPLSRLEQAEVDVILGRPVGGPRQKGGRPAQLIGMHRATLYRKIAGYGLDLDSTFLDRRGRFAECNVPLFRPDPVPLVVTA